MQPAWRRCERTARRTSGRSNGGARKRRSAGRSALDARVDHVRDAQDGGPTGQLAEPHCGAAATVRVQHPGAQEDEQRAEAPFGQGAGGRSARRGRRCTWQPERCRNSVMVRRSIGSASISRTVGEAPPADGLRRCGWHTQSRYGDGRPTVHVEQSGGYAHHWAMGRGRPTTGS